MLQQIRHDQDQSLPFLEPGTIALSHRPPSKDSRWPKLTVAICVQVALIAVYLIYGLRRHPCSIQAPKDHLIAPLFRHPLKIHNQRFLAMEPSPFAGSPSPALDRAWSQLLEGTNIKVSEQELLQRNQTSVNLKKGQGHLAWLEANHQLHCVKWLRQWIYRDHYHPNLTSDEVGHRMLHADHCLELLRQGVMCKADTTLMTFEWVANERKPMLKLRSPEHKCVDWAALQEELSSRLVSDREMEDLVNPLRQ